MSATQIPHPLNRPHLTAAEAAAIYDLSMPTVYQRCNEYLRTGEGIPCLKLGNRTLVLTAKVWEQFGLTPGAPITTGVNLPDPEVKATFTVAEVATDYLGMSLADAARLANRFIETSGAEGLPCVRVGTTRTVVVPNDDALRAYLGQAEPVAA